MNVISKLLRKKDSFYDDVLSKESFWAQTLLSWTLAIIILCIYAALAISGFGWEQALISGLKYVLLFVSSLALCFPTFYVFSALNGSKLEIKEILGLFMGFLLYVSLILIALVPVNWLFAFSGSKNGFLAFLFFFFSTIAFFSGLSFLDKGVRYLNEKMEGSTKATVLLGWSLVFILVLLQMSANLGPWFKENKSIFREDRKNFLEAWNDSLESGYYDTEEDATSDTPVQSQETCPTRDYCDYLETSASYKEYVKQCGCYL